jgi:CheY-like chemotaxis protein
MRRTTRCVPARPFLTAHKFQKAHALARRSRRVPILSQIPNLRAGSKTVLLVEDDPSLLDMLSQTLQRAGFTVVTAVHGIDALAQLRALSVDIVVTDILMPGMDGFELIRMLRAKWAEVPIVAMSGIEDTPNFRNQALKLGAKAALSKPVNRAHLVEVMRDVMLPQPLPGRAAQA